MAMLLTLHGFLNNSSHFIIEKWTPNRSIRTVHSGSHPKSPTDICPYVGAPILSLVVGTWALSRGKCKCLSKVFKKPVSCAHITGCISEPATKNSLLAMAGVDGASLVCLKILHKYPIMLA